MSNAARRRLALAGVATTTALVAGLVIAPAFAAAGGLSITPSGAENSNPAVVLTFNTTQADLRFGGDAVFTRVGGGATFTVGIDEPFPPSNVPDRSQPGVVDLTDVDGDGSAGGAVGRDGPADAGQYAVSATGNTGPEGLPLITGGNDTCQTCFTVLPAGTVSVNSVAPTSLRPGTTSNVSTIGNNFERGTVIEVLTAAGAVDPTVVTNGPPLRANGTAETDAITTRTELRRSWTVGGTAVAGTRDVRVRNLDGSSAVCQGCFSVAGASLTGVAPSAGLNDSGQTVTTVTFTGSSVVDGTMSLEFLGNPGGATRGSLTLLETSPPPAGTVRSTGTSITGTFQLSDAAPGLYQPVVRSSSGVVNACDTCRFTIVQRQERTPTLTSLDRAGAETGSSQAQGATATYDLTGTNFSRGAAVTVGGTGVTTTAVEFVSATLLRATFSTTSAAATGPRSVTVTLTDGKAVTRANSFTVTAAAAPAPATSTAGMFAFERLAGTDRYATAARTAVSTFARSETVLLANGQSDDPRTRRSESHFPDALAGSYLAGDRKGPTLLATETTLPQPTRDALGQLAARNVVILGGTAAISRGVEDQLRRDGFTVTRIAGTNRYETAQRVAQTPASNTVGMDPNGDRTAIVASGQDFADALVSGPLGYAAKFPILITPSASLAPQTRDALRNLGIKRVLITGGTAAVSTGTENQIKAMGITTERFGGQVRSETATLVAAYAYDRLGFDRSHVELARGDQFPDALTGGPHAGFERAPILLTARPDILGTATETFLRNRGGALRDGHIFGGTAAVSTNTEEQAERAVNSSRSGSPSPSGSPSSTRSPAPSGSPGASGSPSPSASSGGLPLPI